MYKYIRYLIFYYDTQICISIIFFDYKRLLYMFSKFSQSGAQSWLRGV